MEFLHDDAKAEVPTQSLIQSSTLTKFQMNVFKTETLYEMSNAATIFLFD